MVNNRNVLMVVLAMLYTVMWAGVSAQEYDFRAKIESRRKGDMITLLFNRKPDRKEYFIIENSLPIGSLSVVSVERYDSKTFRVYARYRIDEKIFEKFIRVGLSIGLRKQKEKPERDYSEKKNPETVEYSERIISFVDHREMVLVKRGKFVFGTNNGDRDEAPEQIRDLDDYYIDKYEVSNNDYLRFMKETNTPPPVTWENRNFSEEQGDLPVIVTYREAESYARWAKKRLPSEMEWEKAARGRGFTYVVKDKTEVETLREPLRYTWGNVFSSEKCNSIHFWEDPKAGKGIKEKYTRGLLPVTTFDKENASPCGAINMIGNAMEWTSSWYRAYEGSRYRNARFGTQVKVLRGGSWMSNSHELRATNRAIGGLPNLYRDAAGGIRCVKNPTVLDRVSGVQTDNIK